MHGSGDVPCSHHPPIRKRYPGLARRQKQAAMRRPDGLPGVLLTRAGIDQAHPGIRPEQRLLNLSGQREQLPTRARREGGRGRVWHLGLYGQPLSPPPGPPSIEEGYLVVFVVAQCPPEPSRPGVVRFGVDDHARPVTDSDCFHDRRERFGRQEQVPHSSLIRPAQVMLPVQVDGSWKMSLPVQLPAGPVASPAGTTTRISPSARCGATQNGSTRGWATKSRICLLHWLFTQTKLRNFH
jgi:hypothetical protein